jgi:cyclopropane fatty-acyl-phospholipid synthase-like methyltransferase
MARTWPSLHVVGLDVWAPALAIARENVRAAQLEERIELREAAGESIADEEAFDLAWIPSLFVPEKVLPELLRRVHRALRPGGWLLFPMLKGSTDPLASAVALLRTAFWGGSLASSEQVEEWLTSAGFADVRTLPSAPVAMTGMVAARKAS